MAAEEAKVLARLMLGELTYLNQLTNAMRNVEHAYNALCFFFDLTDDLAGGRFPLWLLEFRFLPRLRRKDRFWIEPFAWQIAADDRLVLRQCSINSPGFADLIGRLNPLEVLRQYAQDRHERRKDREYREYHERERLALENELLRNKVVRERIELMEQAGVPKTVRSAFVNACLEKPIWQLNRHLDSGEIGGIEFLDSGERAKFR